MLMCDGVTSCRKSMAPGQCSKHDLLKISSGSQPCLRDVQMKSTASLSGHQSNGNDNKQNPFPVTS